MINEKTCPKCGETKPFDCFHKNKSRRDGMAVQCKNCHSDACRKYREANPEKVREIERKCREANREKARETERKYREANLEKVRERTRKWKEANPEKFREGQRKWYANLSDSCVEYLCRRQGIDHLTPEIIELKREQIKLYRALKEAKNGIT